ncbi:hypothetical protein PG993_008421 [Apiospora rasikravindrae]|uniref:Uncharacterized protein n=1 Tax=Apiospora rasikravindrae TaxID=990691 RepID=A0ABR1T234_9PEZI
MSVSNKQSGQSNAGPFNNLNILVRNTSGQYVAQRAAASSDKKDAGVRVAALAPRISSADPSQKGPKFRYCYRVDVQCTSSLESAAASPSAS